MGRHFQISDAARISVTFVINAIIFVQQCHLTLLVFGVGVLVLPIQAKKYIDIMSIIYFFNLHSLTTIPALLLCNWRSRFTDTCFAWIEIGCSEIEMVEWILCYHIACRIYIIYRLE